MKQRLLHFCLWALLAASLIAGGPQPTLAAGQPAAPAAPDAPDANWTDGYGYVMTDTPGIPVPWYDADIEGGTKIGFDPKEGDVSTAIVLPFNFPFYEGIYNQLYVSTNGAISFSGTDYLTFETHKPMPLPPLPNHLIAPLWGGIYLSPGDAFYRTEGTTVGQRVFVIEWELYDPDAPATLILNFEAQFYEVDKSIAFQYNVLDWKPATYSVGIEDGLGANGLQYNGALAVNKGLRFVRPAAGPRGNILPRYNGGLTSAGVGLLPLRVINNGDYGNDAYNMTLATSAPGWQPLLYNKNTGVPLTDSTGDGVVDTGTIAKGASLDLLLRVAAPAGSAPGAATRITVTATSWAAPSKSVSALADVAVPSEFAQVFVDAGIQFRQIWKENVINRSLVSGYTGTTFSMEAVSPENYLISWENLTLITTDGQVLDGVQSLDDGRFMLQDRILEPEISKSYTDIRYRISHVITGPGPQLTLTNGATIINQEPDVTGAHAGAPVIALANNTNILVAWRLSKNRSDFKTNVNLYLNVLNSAGTPVLAQPYAVTGDATWNDNARPYLDHNVLALGDGKYAVCWIDGDSATLRCAFFTPFGAALQPLGEHILASGLPAGFSPIYLNVTAVTDNKLLLAYTGSKVDDVTGEETLVLYYQVINSGGAVLKTGTPIAGASGSYPRAVQLGDENALVVWVQTDGRLGYARIDHSNVVGGFPRYFEKVYYRTASAPSVAVNKAGYAIITWVDGDDNAYIFYSLLNSVGTVITQPLSIVSNPFGSPKYKTSSFGFGNARYSGVYLLNLPITAKP